MHYQARQLREQQRRFDRVQELNREAAMKLEIERQEQINKQLEYLTEIERKQRELIERQKLRERTIDNVEIIKLTTQNLKSDSKFDKNIQKVVKSLVFFDSFIVIIEPRHSPFLL